MLLLLLLLLIRRAVLPLPRLLPPPVRRRNYFHFQRFAWLRFQLRCRWRWRWQWHWHRPLQPEEIRPMPTETQRPYRESTAAAAAAAAAAHRRVRRTAVQPRPSQHRRWQIPIRARCRQWTHTVRGELEGELDQKPAQHDVMIDLKFSWASTQKQSRRQDPITNNKNIWKPCTLKRGYTHLDACTRYGGHGWLRGCANTCTWLAKAGGGDGYT